jgi:adenosylcobinamide-GDP ribazoletransferase
MKNFIAAVQFLTIFRIRRTDVFEPPKMIPYFPVVGLLVGLLLVGVDALAGLLWPRPVAAVVDLLFMVWVTGGLHLDGLGDTADGLYGNRPAEKALAIMKDSRVGAMGVMAIVLGLAVKWGGLAAVDSQRALVLLTVPGFARGSQLLGMRLLPYGRPEGLGQDFCGIPLGLYDFRGLVLTIGVALFAGFRGIVLIVGFFLVSFGVIMFYRRRMNCITGDMLGALAEISESALFLIAAVGGSF